jgi:hypothetical protein
LEFLRYDVSNLVYSIPNLKTGAVIGVGGGRDILSQHLFGVRDVTGVEINPIIIDLLNRRFSDYTAIATLDGVKFEVDEARSWFARTSRFFDVIQMSLIDIWAATGAGAFTLTETVEAWQLFLGRLNPNGLFTVSRWYASGEVNETGRLVSLAVATLLANGATEPRRHLFLAAEGNVATLIVSKSPLSPTALGALKSAAKANEFPVLLSPDTVSPSPVLESIASATDRGTLDRTTTGFYLDLTPPTDARPFFFNQLRFLTLFDADVFSRFADTGVVAGNLVATLTLIMLILISVVLVGVTIIVPWRSTVKEAGRQLAVGGTVYFGLIGIGFMMVEIALLQRMSVFLGHPTYALSIVLFSLILSTGFGSMASERVHLAGASALIVWSVASACYLFALPFWLPALLVHLDGAGLVVRAGLCVLVLAPAGFLMGFGFPTDNSARAVIDEMLGSADGLSPSEFGVHYALAASPARYMVDRNDWNGAAQLQVRPTTFPHAMAVTHFARALGAARAGSPADATADIAKLAELRDTLRERKDIYWSGQVDVQWQIATAWQRYAEGKYEEALKLMNAAADAEDKTNLHPVMPGRVVPARELYGDMLLERGLAKEAFAAYQTAEVSQPNRYRTLVGAAKAAEKLGDKPSAKAYYEKLIALAGGPDVSRPELPAARAFVASN